MHVELNEFDIAVDVAAPETINLALVSKIAGQKKVIMRANI